MIAIGKTPLYLAVLLYQNKDAGKGKLRLPDRKRLRRSPFFPTGQGKPPYLCEVPMPLVPTRAKGTGCTSQIPHGGEVPGFSI